MSAAAAEVKLKAIRIAGVPTLLATPSLDQYAAHGGPHAPWPTVLWCHGFRADALAHAAELERCARAGFLAVGIDAVGHGARQDATIAQRMRATPGGALPVMLDLAAQTVAELPSLIAALAGEHHADTNSVSLVGISMGAFLGYHAVAAGVPLRTLVALLGSPEWRGVTSAHRRPDAFRDTALLSITAERDASVPPAPVRALHMELDQRFGSTTQRRHHELTGAGHLTSAREWEEAMTHTFAWLERERGRRERGAAPGTRDSAT